MQQHTLQHTATHCNTLQHFATYCNTHTPSQRQPGLPRWRPLCSNAWLRGDLWQSRYAVLRSYNNANYLVYMHVFYIFENTFIGHVCKLYYMYVYMTITIYMCITHMSICICSAYFQTRVLDIRATVLHICLYDNNHIFVYYTYVCMQI